MELVHLRDHKLRLTITTSWSKSKWKHSILRMWFISFPTCWIKPCRIWKELLILCRQETHIPNICLLIICMNGSQLCFQIKSCNLGQLSIYKIILLAGILNNMHACKGELHNNHIVNEKYFGDSDAISYIASDHSPVLEYDSLILWLLPAVFLDFLN